MCIYRGVDLNHLSLVSGNCIWTCDSPTLSHIHALIPRGHIYLSCVHLPPMQLSPLHRSCGHTLLHNSWAAVHEQRRLQGGLLFWPKTVFCPPPHAGMMKYYNRTVNACKNIRDSSIHNLTVIIWLSNLQTLMWERFLNSVTRAHGIHQDYFLTCCF